MRSKDPACCHPQKKGSILWNRNVLVFAAVGFLAALACCIPSLETFRSSVLSYFKAIWWAVLLGFLLGGLLDHTVPQEYVSHLLSKRKKRSILVATILGFLMSACSHGILALAIELHKKGASTPVVVTFLLASPWANMPVTLMLLGFFGLKALYIILGALLIAFTTGVTFQFLESKGLIEKNKRTLILEPDYSVLHDIRRRWKGYSFSIPAIREDVRAVLKGAWWLADRTLWWIVIGIGLSALAAAFIPTEWFGRYMGPSFLGLLATLFLATVMEVCSEGTAPLAFEIYKQTAAFGNAFVFLMAGVVTDFTEIGLVWTNIGWRTALWIPVVAVPQVVVLGIIANRIF